MLLDDVEQIKVSIVTISFNQGRFLEACMESVLSQDCPLMEYIVVDPDSTDGSRAIIEKLSNRINKVILEPDNGPADGLNKGFKLANGDIFGYINADDVLVPGAIKKVLNIFSCRPNIDVLYGNGYQIDEKGDRVKKIFATHWGLRSYAHGEANIIQQATFFRRGVFEKVGGFNVNNRTCWDGELLVDMALAGARFKRTKEVFGAFRIYGDSITGSGRLRESLLRDERG